MCKILKLQAFELEHLTQNEGAVLAVLCGHYNSKTKQQPYPGQKRVARMSKVTTRTVQRSIQSLSNQGYMTTGARIRLNNGSFGPNQYYVDAKRIAAEALCYEWVNLGNSAASKARVEQELEEVGYDFRPFFQKLVGVPYDSVTPTHTTQCHLPHDRMSPTHTTQCRTNGGIIDGGSDNTHLDKKKNNNNPVLIDGERSFDCVDKNLMNRQQ